ncbi:DUF6343 family protein [Streptomyces radicis]|uniref:Uncharacterized protein n=1 Tax=Streptomyces radicis TaxID=1750517 RepID=A0A3A9WL69_9ACTN|nr:DUF6343 family protein [Streptomyces radicis]RKN06897.1 hypothetical protein D7319_20935 [Streptomyces radicis]RKN19515.1 hypothetical protein D7318_20400 [Streptomyces radicis]
MVDRRHERTGTEPVTAYSALRLRLLLSGIFLPFFVLLTILFAIWWGISGTWALGGLTLASAVLTVIAAIDLAIILRRRREQGLDQERDTGAGTDTEEDSGGQEAA